MYYYKITKNAFSLYFLTNMLITQSIRLLDASFVWVRCG